MRQAKPSRAKTSHGEPSKSSQGKDQDDDKDGLAQALVGSGGRLLSSFCRTHVDILSNSCQVGWTFVELVLKFCRIAHVLGPNKVSMTFHISCHMKYGDPPGTRSSSIKLTIPIRPTGVG